MTSKWLTGTISAAATILATQAQAAEFPPCSQNLNDRCMQIGGETMKPSPGVKAKQQENVKAVGKKAGEMGKAVGKKAGEVGTAVKKKWHEMTGEKTAAPAPSAIPHGCSPATTPCE